MHTNSNTQAWTHIYKLGRLAALNVEGLVLKWLDRYRGVNCQFQFVLLKSSAAAFQRESTWNWQWQSGIGFVRREKSEQNDQSRTWTPTSFHAHTHTQMYRHVRSCSWSLLQTWHLSQIWRQLWKFIYTPVSQLHGSTYTHTHPELIVALLHGL